MNMKKGLYIIAVALIPVFFSASSTTFQAVS